MKPKYYIQYSESSFLVNKVLRCDLIIPYCNLI